MMKEYDLVIIGTGSAMNILNGYLNNNPEAKVAVIEKDQPGGICLTRGCIPSKILLYPAEIIRTVQHAKQVNLDIEIKDIDFKGIMQRMHQHIDPDIENIGRSLQQSQDLDFYPHPAEFIDEDTLKVGEEIIKGKEFFLCIGSKPLIPPLKGVVNIPYLTSQDVLQLEEKPDSLTIIGGGYIAAEYGHFFAAMGTKVTIIGRNPQFIKQEEPEVSDLAQEKMSEHMDIFTNCEAKELKQNESGKKVVMYHDRTSDEQKSVESDEILIAAGRASNADILKPEKSGIKTDDHGWIIVDEYLRSVSKENVWAFGDAIGRHQFKHTANYESIVAFYNAVLGEKEKVDYHAVPKAVFSYPEIASVGMKQDEAIEAEGKDNVLIGYYKYEDTAKGMAMEVEDYFVKVIVKRDGTILGAHIIGPEASVLIQEVINLMYTPNRSFQPIQAGMHIHPALSEVVERAFGQMMTVDQYEHFKEHGEHQHHHH